MKCPKKNEAPMYTKHASAVSKQMEKIEISRTKNSTKLMHRLIGDTVHEKCPQKRENYTIACDG